MKKTILILALFSISFYCISQSTEIDNLIHQGNLNEALELSNSLENNTQKFNYLGIIYLQKGQYEEAKKYFNNALELHEMDSEQLAVASCYSNIAISEFALGNMTKSLEYHFRSLDIREKENARPDIAASYNDIGLAYFDIDQDKALDYYEKALAIYEQIYDPMDDRVATAHTNIGIVYGKMEFYGDAINSLQEALVIRKKKNGEKHATTAFVLSAIGRVYDNMDDLKMALDYQQQALAIYQQVYGNKHPEIANTYNYIGNIKDQQNEYMEAINSYHKAIVANTNNFEKEDVYSTPIINSNYYNGDLLLLSLQQKAEAFERLHFGKSLKLNDLKVAISHIEICDRLIDELRQQKTNEADKITLGNMASEVYEDGIRMNLSVADVSWKKKKFYEKAFYFSEKSKAAVLLDAIAETNAKSFANIPDELLKKELKFKNEIAYYQQKLAAKPDKQKEEFYRNKLFENNNEYENFTKQLESDFQDYYNLKYNVSLPTVAEIQLLLNENTALLSYFITNHSDRMYVFEITKKGLKTHDINIGTDFNRILSGYRNSIYYNVKSTYISTSFDLYSKLIPKLPNLINQLIIIPAGRLGIIPFEALLTKSSSKSTNYTSLPYLINKYAVSIQYSTVLLTQAKREVKSENNVCLIAPVEFNNHNLPTLPATATEVNAISDVFTNNNLKSTILVKEDASESTIKSNSISNSKYLHFATHGIVNEDKPELSQVFLSSGKSEDGNLFSGEIYNLMLNADLVTLSACQTGLGKIHKGEGIVGLSRALIYSGANNLVVSLWSVADQSTSDLMINFYSEIIKNHKSYGAALQMAKQKMIATNNYSAPYYWAPFELIGK